MAGNSTCQPIYDIGGGGHTFVLKNVQSGEYLSAVSNNSLQQISSSLNDSRLWFTYNTSTLQIKSGYNGMCIDDLGQGYSSQSSTSDSLAFTDCFNIFTQQFVYQPDTGYLVNPNNAYDKCMDGYIGYGHIYMWLCSDGGTNHQWAITLICPPGTVLSYDNIISYSCSSLLIGSHRHTVADTSCSLCPAGTYASSPGTIGSCSPCSAGSN